MTTRTRSRNRLRSQAGVTPRLNPEVLSELARRITPRDHQVLELVWEHRVLTTHQLTAILFPRPRTARDRLLQLHRFAALDRFRPWTPVGAMPCHWVLGPAGAFILAGQRGIEVAELGYRRTNALAIAHSSKLAHQVGVNDFFAQLHAYARRHGAGASVAHWWPERRCAALWGDLARPDAYGRWIEPRSGTGPGADGPVGVDFFLEYDTGSESLGRLVGKLAGYSALAESTGISTPVLFWLPSRAREVNFRKLLQTPEVPVATAVHTAGCDPEGPAGPTWLPAGSTGPRLRLAELADVWPVGTADPAGARPEDRRGQARHRQENTSDQWDSPPDQQDRHENPFENRSGTAGADDEEH